MTDANSAAKPDLHHPVAPSEGQSGKTPLPPEEELTLEEREADLARIAKIAADIDFADPSLTIAFGARTMADIAKFADALLAQVRARDSGPVGQVLSSLLARMKDMNIVETAGQEPGWAARLPVLGGMFDPMAKAQARFNTLADGVDNVVITLQEAMTRLLRDIEIMEQLYGLNRNFYHELTLDIAAGKKRLEQAYAEDLPRLQDRTRQAGAEQGSLDAQTARDFADKLNRFERRLYDLQLARAVTLQTAPQIRLIQGNDQTLAEKIQAGILTAIPIWKAQMVLALSVHGQKQAARLQREVSDTTNELLRKNAELLHEATVDTAREAERGVVDIESLRQVHDQLLSTVEETLRIAAEARDKRRVVEKELRRMEDDLRNRLADLGGAKTPPPSSAVEKSNEEPARAANGAIAQPPAPEELKLDSPELSRPHLDSPELERRPLSGSQLDTPCLEPQKSPAAAPIAMGRGDAPQKPSGPPIAMGRGDEQDGGRE